jgi:uncharacterized protein YcaQ
VVSEAFQDQGAHVTRVEMELSRDEARWLAVIAAGLDRRPFRRRPTSADIMATIRQLGYVQLDTISVISRAHETVLWSRLGPYDTSLISTLYDPGLDLTEYLAHAAAIIPLDTLPLFRSRMEAFRESYAWPHEEANRAVMDRVLSRIAQDGPLASRNFDRPEDGRRAAAWEWHGLKPERQALDALWLRGETILRQRDSGFSRVFDLPDNVVPGFWEADPIPDEERDRMFARKSMQVLGIGSARWVSDYFRTGGKSYLGVARAKALLAEMETDGAIARVSIPGVDEPTWLDGTLAGRVDDLRRGRGRPSLTTLLSPFDHLVWNRDRDEKLFDFEYRIECYTPAPKRRYGYFTHPILYRGRIIGRLDPSYDRQRRVLTIKSLHLEPWVRASAAMAAAIVQAIEDLLKFLGGEQGSWVLLHANPPQILPLMTLGGNVGVGDESGFASALPGGHRGQE